MERRQRKKSTIPDFTLLARQIDSKVDSKLLSEMHHLECMNAMVDLFWPNKDELIPVGSCVDGSKVTIQGDSGDLDVLVISNQILLEESLFDYNVRHPVFLHIRLEREHKTFFHDIVDPEQGEYLPVYVLKQFHKKLFCFGRFIFQQAKSTGISKDGDYFNLTRNSSVGVERTQFDSDKFFSLGYKSHQENLNSALSNFGKTVLGICNMFHQRFADRLDDKALQNISNDEYIRMFYQTVEKFAQEDEKGKQDDVERVLKQELSLNTNLEKDLQENNTTEKQNENVNISDPKEMALHQRDTDEVVQINAGADSASIFTDKSCSEQQIQKREGQKMNEDKSDITEQALLNRNKLSFRKFKSADFVPAFKFKGWPRPAEEWIYRRRRWPPKRIMKEVLDVGCQVVAKRPRVLFSEDLSYSNVAMEDNDIFFRLSFARCEVAIAKDMSEQQLLCWRVLKAYQNCFLKTKPQGITSYHWKNVIFWVSEELDKSYWDNSHVLDGVERSLDFMISCLEQKNLPFYFVRRMNLLHGYNETMITDVCTRIRTIRSSPILYLKQFLKFQGISNVVSISIDHEIIGDVISGKHKTKEKNQQYDLFIDLTEIFCKNVFEIEKLNIESKVNNVAQVLKHFLNASDDEDKEMKYLSLTIVEMFEKVPFDKKEITMKAFDNTIKAFENLIKNHLKNEEMQKEICESNGTQAYELITVLTQCLTCVQKHKHNLTEKFCDAFEKVKKVATDGWKRKIESEDEKTKGNVNAVISLMDKFSTFISHNKNVIKKDTTGNKKFMDIELD